MISLRDSPGSELSSITVTGIIPECFSTNPKVSFIYADVDSLPKKKNVNLSTLDHIVLGGSRFSRLKRIAQSLWRVA